MVRTLALRRRRFCRAAVLAAAIGLGHGCLKVDLQDGFPCSAAGLCPFPYRCYADGNCYRRPPELDAGGIGVGAGGQSGGDGAASADGDAQQPGSDVLSLSPGSATFDSTLVGGTSAGQTFSIRNPAAVTAGTTTALSVALSGSNAAEFRLTSNTCAGTLDPGSSCSVTVAFAPLTRSGSRSASLGISAGPGGTAAVTLAGAALPSLTLLAGGVGSWGNADGTGTNARFNVPTGIANDGAGDLIISDSENGVIRKIVIATGEVSTIAGAGVGANDGVGLAAGFLSPGDMTSDGNGNVFILDANNHTIRQLVIASGAVTTLAGKSLTTGTVDGTGAAARFAYPAGITYDGAGNLFVTDTDTIRKIVIATAAVSTFAGVAGQSAFVDGTGAAARFIAPGRIASDGAGNLFVIDDATIRKVVIATGAVSTFAGATGLAAVTDGTGTSARFQGPAAITADGAGSLFVSDLNSIRRVVIATAVVTTRAGAASEQGSTDGVGTSARFSYPEGIATDGAGNLFVTDSDNDMVRRIVVTTGTVSTVAGMATSVGSADGVGQAAQFNRPDDITTDGTGNLFVVDSYGNTIRKVVLATGAVSTFVGTANVTGSADGTGSSALFNGPVGITNDGAGNLFVTDAGNCTIRQVVAATGVVSTIAGAPQQCGVGDGIGSSAQFNSPAGITSDGRGHLFVADSNGNTIRMVSLASGTVTTLAGSPGQYGSADATGKSALFNSPYGVTNDGAGNLFVTDSGNCTIRQVVIATGAVTTIAGGVRMCTSGDGTGTAARFGILAGITNDGAGNLYIADSSRTVRKLVIATGVVTTVVGTAGRTGVALGALPGSLAVPVATAVLPTGELAIVDAVANAVLVAHP